LLDQLIGQRNAVDALAPVVKVLHPRENAAMLFEAEVLRFERSGDLQVKNVVQKDGAEHEPLGIETCG
jgi:hypothetical protein